VSLITIDTGARDDEDREKCLATLTEVCRQTGWQVHAYCLMRNHVHLVVETPQPNLVCGMKCLLGTYTKRFTKPRTINQPKAPPAVSIVMSDTCMHLHAPLVGRLVTANVDNLPGRVATGIADARGEADVHHLMVGRPLL
jgi:hypothetical protein